MTIGIYAQGGGWGHLTRATALSNALRPRDVRILSNSPYRVPDAVLTNDLASCDLLIVDTFPRGLLGELTTHPARHKILVHRDLNPAYIAWAGADTLRRFVESQYDLILCPGESGPFCDLAQAHHTRPWLIRAPRPAPPTEILIVAAGNSDELAWYGATTALLGPRSRCLAPSLPPGCPPELWINYWPAIDYIAHAQVVIGGAGYNTINECLATGTPLVAKPWPRKYDRQLERAQRSAFRVVDTPVQAAQAALEAPQPHRPPFRNGATEAADLITELEELISEQSAI